MITQEILKKRLSYDQLTGVFTWIKSNNSSVANGEIAGCVNSSGYFQIGINGKYYLSHRLAFLYRLYGITCVILKELIMADHTKEPWAYQKECVGNYQIGHDHSGAGTVEVTARAITEANARRVVACVNACSGLDTELLENIVLTGDTLKHRFEALIAGVEYD